MSNFSLSIDSIRKLFFDEPLPEKKIDSSNEEALILAQILSPFSNKIVWCSGKCSSSYIPSDIVSYSLINL